MLPLKPILNINFFKTKSCKLHDDDYHYCIIDEDSSVAADSYMQLLYNYAEQYEPQL